MDYKGINDYEQLYLISENDEEARNLVYDKYKPIVISIASKYMNKNIDKVDLDDLIQEGYIGLDKAIRTFRETANACFYTFANICIEGQILSYLRGYNTKKNYVLNKSYYIDDIDYNRLLSVRQLNEDLIKNSDPAEYLNESFYNRMCIDFKHTLAMNDSCIFELRYNGFKYKEIAKLLGISVSTVDTRLRHIKERFLKYSNK